MTDPTSLTLAEIRVALQARRLRAVDLLSATLDAIDRSQRQDPPLNAFISVTGPELEGQAAEVDRALDAGADIGPLAGIPLAIKDNICTGSLPTTCGSRILEG